MKKMTLMGVVFCMVFAVSLFSQADACSVFRVKAKDGTIISARTMEFGMDLGYAVIAVPRNKEFKSPAPDTGSGLKWKTRYGYVAVNVMGDVTIATDGMNEAGLSFSQLWYENDMQWQSVGPKEKAAALSNAMFGTWVLGNFSTVSDVSRELSKVKVFGYKAPQTGGATVPAHFIINDAQGGCIVVEYDQGQLHVYDDPLGIMTNAPSFPWMLDNLRNYVGMTNNQLTPTDFAGMPFNSTGHGGGMIGLPGDITPPSRFVRMAVMTKYADQQADAPGALNLAQHIVSALHIVKGMIVDRDKSGKVTASETTQWSSYRDLTNRVFYYRTYDNFNLRKIDLKSLDFTARNVKTIKMTADKEIITDITGRLQ